MKYKAVQIYGKTQFCVEHYPFEFTGFFLLVHIISKSTY